MWPIPRTQTLGRAAVLIAGLAAFGGPFSLAHGQAMLGEPPDRIDYTVESADDLIRPDSVNCASPGLNGTDAVYRREQRHYVQWENGLMVRDWVGQTDVFDHCRSPGADNRLRPRPDGISYTVLEATEVPKADLVACPGGSTAIYRRESRQYSERRNGQVVRRWRTLVDVFDRCADS